MKDAKEFHGKNLDEAIKSACQFYGVEREKLEIEIVNDSKMGIFGLVNVKKACVRASLADTDSILEGLAETLTQPEPQAPKGRRAQGAKAEKTKGSKPAPKAAPKSGSKPAPKESEKETQKGLDSVEAETAESALDMAEGEEKSTGLSHGPVQAGQAAKGGRPAREAKVSADESGSSATTAKQRGRKAEAGESVEEDKEKPAGRSQKRERPAPRQENRSRRGRGADRRVADGDNGADNEDNNSGEGFSLADLESYNQDELRAMIHDVVNRLVSSIIGEVPLTITIDEGHIRVKVDCEEDARILVGREGQTLASVQYIASRILAGKLQGAVRLHIDTGNYKENQDARLTGLAQMLAEKLRKSGRTQSTRPLSAYQRRIVHLALEDEEDIQTSSKGDGPQRRVLIHFKRNRNQKNTAQVEQEQENEQLAPEACEGADVQVCSDAPLDRPAQAPLEASLSTEEVVETAGAEDEAGEADDVKA